MKGTLPKIDPTARLYRDVRVEASEIGRNSIIADNSDVIRSTIAEHCEVGRRNLVIDSFMGRGSYTGSNSVIHDSRIGSFCCISWGVSLGGFTHNYRAASLYSAGNWKRRFGIEVDAASERREPTVIGSDVWLASGVNVIGGVRIGHGAVLGAGAVAVRDVPPFAVAVGVPARVVGYRFCPEWIERMLGIAWWEWEWDLVSECADLLFGDLDERKLSLLEEAAAG